MVVRRKALVRRKAQGRAYVLARGGVEPLRDLGCKSNTKESERESLATHKLMADSRHPERRKPNRTKQEHRP